MYPKTIQCITGGAANKYAPDPCTEIELHLEALRNALTHLEKALPLMSSQVSNRITHAELYRASEMACLLLPLRDCLEIEISMLPDEAPAFKAELIAALRQLEKTFDQAGISEINPIAGEPFDSDRHAVELRHAYLKSGSQITKVVQKGFEVEGRVLRPALVILEQ